MMVFRRGWQSYLNLLNRRPLATQMAQAGFLMGTGDFISQTIIEKADNKPYDYTRTARYN